MGGIFGQEKRTAVISKIISIVWDCEYCSNKKLRISDMAYF